ncbi:DUF397 domain-containing protein [Streptomyces sp. NPDC051207]|uniref:DUF397 domain-containing protein n=1 Tax=Streptomyces sp. NPDC051207 TaxID=3154641 RepID=UPI0034495761
MSRKTSSGDASGLAWFKSCYSRDAETDSCVEIATGPGTVHVRDSKDTAGPRPAFSPAPRTRFPPYEVKG